MSVRPFVRSSVRFKFVQSYQSSIFWHRFSQWSLSSLSALSQHSQALFRLSSGSLQALFRLSLLEQSQCSPSAVLEQSQSSPRAFLAFLEQNILSHSVGAQNTSSCSQTMNIIFSCNYVNTFLYKESKSNNRLKEKYTHSCLRKKKMHKI